MKQDIKETIGPRGTVPGYRPLIGSERWHRSDFVARMLEGGWRPIMDDEVGSGEIYHEDRGWVRMVRCQERVPASKGCNHCRTKRPLPQPQVETFEAHGHVWYRHVPGSPQPVEDSVVVDILWRHELDKDRYNSCINPSEEVYWDTKDYAPNQELIGYRFPDYPATHNPASQLQEQPSTELQQLRDFKHRASELYTGWCDVVPDSVAECMEDVSRLLHPTDEQRCEAAFERWFNGSDGLVGEPSDIWQAAWNAAKESK